MYLPKYIQGILVVLLLSNYEYKSIYTYLNAHSFNSLIYIQLHWIIFQCIGNYIIIYAYYINQVNAKHYLEHMLAVRSDITPQWSRRISFISPDVDKNKHYSMLLLGYS